MVRDQAFGGPIGCAPWCPTSVVRSGYDDRVAGAWAHAYGREEVARINGTIPGLRGPPRYKVKLQVRGDFRRNPGAAYDVSGPPLVRICQQPARVFLAAQAVEPAHTNLDAPGHLGTN